MRQAGRSDPAYRCYRQRAGVPLEELFRSPKHAVAISLLPERIGVDALIIFQDILTVLEPMGVPFVFRPGPQRAVPFATAHDVRRLKSIVPRRQLAFVGETLDGLGEACQGRLPLLGFAGAPLTLAAFLLAGKSPGDDLEALFAFEKRYPEAFAELIHRLTEETIAYLAYQAEAGADAVQLFESVGDRLPAAFYRRYAAPSHRRIFAQLPRGTPRILFVKGSAQLKAMQTSGAEAISVAADVDLAALQRAIQGSGEQNPGMPNSSGPIAIQGHVSNVLLADGDTEAIGAAVREALAATGGQGHILNLDHGILPQTPFANVRCFVEAARAFRAPGASA